ncbi:unnamed protein product [Vicia faba]|uniref:Reverse transcriptase zinc-binding domain-containing protein n=1 Tax=Vicia faba TaxID=3906 RepID=A0AAV0YML6_VICFA|nr:unnamed protein product [Vicia faba]
MAAMEAFELIEILTMVNIIDEHNDTCRWCPNQDGGFSVKSCYNCLRDIELEDVILEEINGVLQRLWKTCTPSKTKVFGWRVMLNRLPTKDQLVRRWIIYNEEDKVCVLGLNGLEDLEHLMFKCMISLRVWRKIYGWLELDMEEELVGVNHFYHLTNGRAGKVRKRNIDMV